MFTRSACILVLVLPLLLFTIWFKVFVFKVVRGLSKAHELRRDWVTMQGMHGVQ